MNRKSFIKNTFGVIIGYALLPKVLTQAKEPISLCDKLTPAVNAMPGIGGTTFKMKMNCSWFGKGDIIRSSALQSDFIFLEKTEKGFKGKFLNNKQFEFIEVEYQEPIVTYKSISNDSLEIPHNLLSKSDYFIGYDGYVTESKLYSENSNEIIYKIANAFIEEAEIV